MKQLSAEECISYILQDIDKRRTVDYSDKNSVRRYNVAMDRIIEKANYLCDNYPEKMGLFIALLDHPDYQIAGTCTSVLFGLHSATEDHKLAALNSAKRLQLRPDLDEIGEYVWAVNIERWEAKMGDKGLVCVNPSEKQDRGRFCVF
jgi:hypothetical protein